MNTWPQTPCNIALPTALRLRTQSGGVARLTDFRILGLSDVSVFFGITPQPLLKPENTYSYVPSFILSVFPIYPVDLSIDPSIYHGKAPIHYSQPLKPWNHRAALCPCSQAMPPRALIRSNLPRKGVPGQELEM